MTRVDDPIAPAVERVRQRFLADAGAAPEDATRHLERLLSEEAPLLGPVVRGDLARELSTDLVGLGSLERLLRDDDVTDVLVNGPGAVWVERRGRLERTEVRVDPADLARSIERLVGPLGLRADRAHPIVDARLPDGTRVSVVLPPLAVDGPVLAIRRHGTRVVPLSAFAPPDVVDLLEQLVRERANLVVYGATGSGKTTLLNALLGGVDVHERIITIEDVAELRLPGEHVVRLEARATGEPAASNRAGVDGTALRDLVRAALRLRPDRLVVGEVRGPEALDMIWALSTGHDGCCSTCHAADGADALRRIETMATLGAPAIPLHAVREQLHAAVDVLIGVARGADGARRVVAIDRIGADGELLPLLDRRHTIAASGIGAAT